MTVTIAGYAPVYTPTQAPDRPEPPTDKSDAAAALNEALAAAKRALEAARRAQAELEKAQKALKDNKDASKTQALQGDVDTKQVTADRTSADLKVATKNCLALGGPQGQDKVAGQLKALDGKDEHWGDLVDTAKKEQPDIAIVASGKPETDAAARRVAGAYASGGDAAAAKQLRTELESAKTPQERSAILHSAMPVVDRVAKDLGINGRRTDGDWGQKGEGPAGPYTNDADNPNPIDTRAEFDHTLVDLEASVDLAGDKEAAFHIANDILQVMPGGTQGNSANNLLGLLGLDLAQSSPDRSSMLETALSAALVQPDPAGPAVKPGTELATPLGERDRAARLLSPDVKATVTVRDWTDEKGVKHDGTIWHEIEQNPDLFLTAKQQADIAQRSQGWPASEVLKEKTARGLQNLREQNPGQDVDQAKSGDTFSFDAGDLRTGLPKPPGEKVQTAVEQSKAAHPGDLQYGVDLDTLVHSDAFRKLSAEQQVDAVGQFDRTLTQAAEARKPLEAGTKDQLRELITSSSFHGVNGRVQERLLGLFSEFAQNGPGHLDGLKRLIEHGGFRTLDSEAGEFKVLAAYQQDGIHRGIVDKLTARTDLSPADARTALEQLTHVQADRQLYEKSSDGGKQKILDSVYQAVTDARFRGFAQNQKDAAINKLVKYHDEEYALRPDGVDTALVEAGKIKPQAAQSTPDSQPTTPPSTQAGPPTTQSVKADLARVEAGAHEVATSDKTINDPLRRVAGEDPVTYAYLKVQAERKGDKLYLKLLDEAMPQHRRDYTSQQVKDLIAKGEPDQAMKLLDTQLDATKDPAERQQLWQAAGQPSFSRAYFDQQIDKLLEGQGLALEGMGKLFSQVGENAPPEAAGLMLDAIKSHLDKGPDDRLWQLLVNDVSVNADTYEGLSLLTERADALGANRSDEFANFYATAFDKVSRDPRLAPSTALVLTGGPEGGLYRKISESIADHGAAKLSVALYNAAKKHASGPDMGGGRDWTQTIENRTRNSIRDGIREFRGNLADDVTTWQEDNKNALRLVQDYGGLDPEGVARAIARDRKAHPDTYYKLEDGKPAGADVSYAKMEQRGVQLDGLMRDINGLDLNFDKPSVPAEKQLGDEIESLDKDPVALSTLQNNQALDEHRASQLNFGNFAPANSPWNPTAVVGSQRDHLEKLVRDYHVPAELATQLGQRTDRWETDLRAELGKGDKASDDKLRSLTDDYRKDAQALLEGKVPNGGEGVLVKPSGEVVEEIRNARKSIGTVTSTLRLTINWYRDSGDSLLRTYSQVAFRRGLNGAGQFDPDSTLIRNAARLGLSDEKSVDKAMKFMQDMQAKIDSHVSADKPKLTADEYKTLMAEFKRQAPQFGPVEPFDPKASPEAMKTSERVTRGLGMLCFFGSAVNNGVNAYNEPGVTSSDAFAALFGTGVVVEAYRSGKGLEMQGGKLQEGLQKVGWGPNGAEQLSKFFKSNALGSLVAVADLAWAYEDFTGYTLAGNKTTGEGDKWAGALTTGLVAADLLEIGAAGWRARLATMAAAEGATIAGAGWAPVVGWVAAGLQAVFLGARFAYGVTKDKNKFEFDDNPAYADMVKSLGFTEDQARELMNQSGGNTDVKVNDWEWFIPGWNSWQSIHSTFGYAESFFQEGAMGPMHVLNPLFDANEVPQQQRLQYLQSLSADEMKSLIGQTHKILDDEMTDEGVITSDSTNGLEQWMKDHQLWKNEYLGAA